MRKQIPLWLAVLSFALLADGAVAQSLRTSRIPTQQSLARYDLYRQWWNQAALDPGSDRVEHVVVDEHNLYVQSDRGMLSTFDAETGEARWARLLGGGTEIGFPLTTNATQVIVATGLRLVAFDKFNGDEQWQLTLSKQPSAGPGVDDNRVYVGSLDGSLYAYNLQAIRDLFSEGKLPEYTGNTIEWRYKAPLEITSPPLPLGLLVYYASESGSLFSVSTADGQLNYQLETSAAIRAPLSHADGLIYLASTDTNLFCVDAISGNVRWTFASGFAIPEKPRVFGPHCYVSPRRSGTYCLDAKTGQRLWRNPKAANFTAATAKHLYARDELGAFLKIDRETGATLARIPTLGFPHDADNDFSDRIYLVSQDGLILCLRETDHTFPMYHGQPERQPIMPQFGDDAEVLEEEAAP